MKSVQLMDCTEGMTIKLERVNFFNRQLLTAEDMNTERDYFLQKLRRHNRFLHGWGVVCGLAVKAAPVVAAPWRVQVGSGYALGPYGDEIFVADPVYFDLAACLSGGITSPCEPNVLLPGAAGTSTTVYLAIKYSECLARPVQVAYSGCGCDDDPCQYSRICDSFQIQCLPKLPEQPPAFQVSLCDIWNGLLAPCPPCPTNPWVVLAKIVLPSSSSTDIADANIETRGRRTVVSTAILQEQIIRCCCGDQEPPPPPPPPPARVGLKDILVRPSATPTSVPPPWTNSVTLPSTRAPLLFDFVLELTGPAPAGGMPIKVIASAPAPAIVTLASPSPVLIPAGQASQQVPGNSVKFSNPHFEGTRTITLTATDGTNSPTATVVVSPPPG
jgi:hypothetical protein